MESDLAGRSSAEEEKLRKQIAEQLAAFGPLQPLLDDPQIEASSSELKTVRVRLCSLWRPIFENYMFSEMGKVCSEGLARRGR
jgi:hypothetical protein